MTIGQLKLLLQVIDDSTEVQMLFSVNGYLDGHEPFLLHTADNFITITPAFLATEYIKRERDEVTK